MAHPNGGVKEQVAGLFAQRLAENGYIAIAADASFQGASEGTPRMVDNPAYRVEDIHGMADALSLFPGVDYDRMAAFGICGGGGFTPYVLAKLTNALRLLPRYLHLTQD